MIRRGTNYGPMLPDGVLEDDGVDRGIVFVFAGSHLKRQFEFVKTQWINDGVFIGVPDEKRPTGRAAATDRLHHPARAHPSSAARPAVIHGDPRRRVLLRARPESPEVAGASWRPEEKL